MISSKPHISINILKHSHGFCWSLSYVKKIIPFQVVMRGRTTAMASRRPAAPARCRWLGWRLAFRIKHWNNLEHMGIACTYFVQPAKTRYGHTMTYHQHLQSKNHGNDGNHGDRTGWSFVNFAAKPSLRTIPKGSKGTMGRSGTAASCATRFQAMLFFSYRFHRHDVAKNDQQWKSDCLKGCTRWYTMCIYIYIIYILCI